MNLAKATAIAEGDHLPRDDAEYIEAWQLLVDSGLAWQLSGKVGEKATKMITSGILSPGNFRGLFDGENNGTETSQSVD